MISFLVLFLINILILLNTREPKELLEVKERYRTLREHLKKTNNKKFAVLVTPIPITGLKKMTGTVGYNVNKGADITLCLDGDTNEIMHVLMGSLQKLLGTIYRVERNM